MRAQLNDDTHERQRSARNDPDMRDGDSGHGNPGEPAGDRNAIDSDTDVGDTGPATGGADLERREDFDELRQEFEGDRQQRGPDFGETVRPEVGGKPEPVSDRDLPIRNYRRLTVPEIIRQTQRLDLAQLKEILAFERAHRKRKTLIAELVRIVGEENAKA